MRFMHTALLASTLAAASAGVALGDQHDVSAGSELRSGDPRVSTLFADLQTVNAAQGARATGRANIVVREWADWAEIDFHVRASGLERERAHLVTVQGLFAEDPTPDANPATVDQGSFFESEGGRPIASRVPRLPDNDVNGDGYLTFVEALPAQGPVIEHLSLTQFRHPVSGVSPTQALTVRTRSELGINASADDRERLLRDLFPTTDEFGNLDYEATFTYDLRNQDARRQFNNLVPMADNRLIVIHGLTINESTLDLGEFNRNSITQEGYDYTAPVASGVVTGPMPAAVGPGLMILAALGLRRRRVRGA